MIAPGARLAGMDESIFEATRDLGAMPWATFRRITLPLILPEVTAVSTLLMALTLTLIFLASRFAPDALKGRR